MQLTAAEQQQVAAWHSRMAEARTRRQTRMDARIRWFSDRFERGLQLTMSQRLRVAVQLLRDQIVINLSTPVVKVRRKRTRDTSWGAKGSSYTWVDPASRSRPGEYPHAETTRLMKDIFYDFPTPLSAIIGTSLKYGVRLEVLMNRSFLRRTLWEMQPILADILTRGTGGTMRIV